MESGETRVLTSQDATMTDFSEKGRPPEEPPDGGQSWATKVSGMSAGGGLTPEAILDEEFVSS